MLATNCPRGSMVGLATLYPPHEQLPPACEGPAPPCPIRSNSAPAAIVERGRICRPLIGSVISRPIDWGFDREPSSAMSKGDARRAGVGIHRTYAPATADALFTVSGAAGDRVVSEVKETCLRSLGRRITLDEALKDSTNPSRRLAQNCTIAPRAYAFD